MKRAIIPYKIFCVSVVKRRLDRRYWEPFEAYVKGTIGGKRPTCISTEVMIIFLSERSIFAPAAKKPPFQVFCAGHLVTSILSVPHKL